MKKKYFSDLLNYLGNNKKNKLYFVKIGAIDSDIRMRAHTHTHVDGQLNNF